MRLDAYRKLCYYGGEGVMTITRDEIIKCVAASLLGTAAFVALTKVQIPMPLVQNTSLQVRTCLLVLVAAYFDPVSAFIMGFAGHAISDTLFYGGAWWSWVIPDGLQGLAMGLMAVKCHFKRFTVPIYAAAMLYLVQFAASMAAWFVAAPILDVVIYGEDMSTVLYQGLIAALGNVIISAAVCTPVAALYALYTGAHQE